MEDTPSRFSHFKIKLWGAWSVQLAMQGVERAAVATRAALVYYEGHHSAHSLSHVAGLLAKICCKQLMCFLSTGIKKIFESYSWDTRMNDAGEKVHDVSVQASPRC